MTQKKTLVTGATGFVGQSLLKHIDAPVILTRNLAATKLKNPEAEVYEWNPSEGVFPKEALKDVTQVVHLAGESVGEGRWSAEKKRRILASRVDGTRTIVNALRDNDHSVKTLVSASAIGFYGDQGEETLVEQSEVGGDFLAEVCHAWEEEA
ncbi:MAG: NAD-dependent epimerase/dehydratase family protein, partial [Planctomycetota bacterium]|nr:NAD-dependent epimerase/dehydratase family protein [Planctomycetota bacterium]